MLRILNHSMHSARSARLLGRSMESVRVSCARHLNLLEYQSKELLRDSGVSVQNFAIVDDLTKTNSALEKLRECFPPRYLHTFVYVRRTHDAQHYVLSCFRSQHVTYQLCPHVCLLY